MRQYSMLVIFASLSVVAPVIAQQNLGVFGGVQRSNWRTPGYAVASMDRIEFGGFSAMQLHTNWILRNELAVGVGVSTTSGPTLERVRIATMLRFYPKNRLYGGLGMELLANLGHRAEMQEIIGSGLPAGDLHVFTGIGARLSDRSEIGVRAGIGMLAKVEVPELGSARDHSFSMLYGHLIRGRSPAFVKRRLWKRKVGGTVPI